MLVNNLFYFCIGIKYASRTRVILGYLNTHKCLFKYMTNNFIYENKRFDVFYGIVDSSATK